jgi:hypothetical protein
VSCILNTRSPLKARKPLMSDQGLTKHLSKNVITRKGLYEYADRISIHKQFDGTVIVFDGRLQDYPCSRI